MKLTLALISLLALCLSAALPAASPAAPQAKGQSVSAKVEQTASTPYTPPTSFAAPAVTKVTAKALPASRFKVVPPRQLLGEAGTAKTKGPLFRGGAFGRQSIVSYAAKPRITAAQPLAPKTVLYNGLNKAGIPATDAATSGSAPPDSTGAIGPNNYVEMANSEIHVWDRNLNTVASSSLAAFMGDTNLSDPWCDPQVQWDQSANRWLFSFLFCNTQTTTQGFEFGWSRTSDPSNLATGWCTFGVTTSGFLFDYDKLGHSRNYVILGGNFYDETGAPNPNPPFFTADIFWAPVPSNGVTTCPATIPLGQANTPLLNGDNATPTFTPVPVNTDSSAANGYIVSAYFAGAAAQAKLAIWHVDAAGVLHQDPDIAVNSYSPPPPAPQSGTTDVIDTLDGRLTQAVGDPGTGIWTQHTVDNAGISKVTWYELALAGAALSKVQEGDLTNGTDYLFNASISPSFNAQGAAVFYNRSSASLDPVIAARVRISATPVNTMAPGELVLASSLAADTDGTCNNPVVVPMVPCRWGDYSGASPDPVTPYAVWGTGEFNTATGTTPAWQNQNYAVNAGVVPPGPPTSVTATNGDDAFSCVRWTPSILFDGGAPDLSYTIRAYQGVTLVHSLVIAAPTTIGCILGLTNGLPYTFTVSATNVAGAGPESAHSTAVTPVRGALPAGSAASSARGPVNPAPTPNPPPSR